MLILLYWPIRKIYQKGEEKWWPEMPNWKATKREKADLSSPNEIHSGTCHNVSKQQVLTISGRKWRNHPHIDRPRTFTIIIQTNRFWRSRLLAFSFRWTVWRENQWREHHHPVVCSDQESPITRELFCAFAIRHEQMIHCRLVYSGDDT